MPHNPSKKRTENKIKQNKERTKKIKIRNKKRRKSPEKFQVKTITKTKTKNAFNLAEFKQLKRKHAFPQKVDTHRNPLAYPGSRLQNRYPWPPSARRVPK